MKVQFDWRFDDEYTSNEERVRKPSDVIQTSLITHHAYVSRVTASHLRRQAWQTRSQRRLQAALARTKPWQCPVGEPDWFRYGYRSLRGPRRVQFAWRGRGSKRRPGDPWMTRRQRRLHAALARTRPWLCPQVWPEQNTCLLECLQRRIRHHWTR